MSTTCEKIEKKCEKKIKIILTIFSLLYLF